MRRSRPDNPRDVRGWYSTMQASRAASKRRTGTVVPHDSHTSVTASSSTSIWSGSKTTGAQHSRHATWVTWPDPRWRLSMMAKRRPRAERYTSSRSPVGGHTPQGPRRPRQPSSSHRPHVSVMTRSPTTASFLAMGGRGVRLGPCKPPVLRQFTVGKGAPRVTSRADAQRIVACSTTLPAGAGRARTAQSAPASRTAHGSAGRQ